MDPRKERTKQNIEDVFIELRRKKDIEKITIKEISQLAHINKATFYHYFNDIYNLTDTIEDELIKKCLEKIPPVENLFDVDEIKTILINFLSQSDVFNVVFSGSRRNFALQKIYTRFMDLLFIKYPEFRNDIQKKSVFTAIIYGIYASFSLYGRMDNFSILVDSYSRCGKLLIQDLLLN